MGLTLEEWKERLLIEFIEVNGRTSKLEEFVKNSSIYEGMDTSSKLLLKNQLHYMLGYRQCLYDRINLTVSPTEIATFDNGRIEIK